MIGQVPHPTFAYGAAGRGELGKRRFERRLGCQRPQLSKQRPPRGSQRIGLRLMRRGQRGDNVLAQRHQSIGGYGDRRVSPPDAQKRTAVDQPVQLDRREISSQAEIAESDDTFELQNTKERLRRIGFSGRIEHREPRRKPPSAPWRKRIDDASAG